MRDGGRDGAGGEIPACGKDDGVAGTTQVAIEYQFVAVKLVAGRGSVGFGDAQADGLALFHWRKRNQDNLGGRRDGFAGVDFGGGEIGASHHFGGKLFASIQDVGGRIGDGATFADDVQVFVGAFVGFGVVVVEAEGVSFGLLEEVIDIAVLVGALG